MNLNRTPDIFDLLDEPDPPSPRRSDGPPRSLTSHVDTPHDSALASIYAEVGGSPSDQPVHAKPSTLRNPYDGTIIGEAVLANPHMHADMNILQPLPSKPEEQIWQQLSKVLDIQSKIASNHLAMEGIGIRGDPRAKGKGIQSHSNIWESMASKERVTSIPERTGSDAEDVDLNPEEEEEKRNREREEEFAKLARQFKGRKEHVIEIMDQLDDLSKALTQFHQLQAPQIDFSVEPNSRASTYDPLASAMASAPAVAPNHSHRRNSTLAPPLILTTLEGGIQPRMVDSPEHTDFSHNS
ncbi:hypothetical protein CYLTODRAFT_454689 [Cylindrobasidium torrendii FP15055 ss-10]|uniref:Uncharacterized protein n=1 Tax=Cylindrobasidium torrendii FP15055 ss-10 TaxID=1314674 RepID=A0A0D7BCF5_9AGAR|nr:hypothetical protein CYLTODRAFT_454689 [Cylindrobasidium torrendii FP15055 ss-10]